MISVSRLMLDNIPHIKAYRMNIGDKPPPFVSIAVPMTWMELLVMKKLCTRLAVKQALRQARSNLQE